MKEHEKERREREELERYGGDVLRSDLMRKAFKQKHHMRTTVGEHTMRVTRASIKIGHALQKLHVPVDMSSVVVGSLCHDLGIIGRDEKYSSNYECYRKHPDDSVEAAEKLLGKLPEKTRDVIRCHMWPIPQTKMPRSIEGFIVSAADKYSSAADLIKGRRKHTEEKKTGE